MDTTYRNKIVIVGFFAVLCVIIIAIVLMGGDDEENKEQATVESVQSNSSQQYERFSDIDSDFDVVATTQEATDYLFSHKRSDGFTTWSARIRELCNEDDRFCAYTNENVGFPYQLANSWTALGFYGGYRVTGESRYKQQALADMRRVYDWCLPQMESCLWILAQPALMYRTEKQAYLQDFVQQGADLLLQRSPDPNLMLHSIEARSLALAYEATGDEKYLEGAKQRFKSAEALLATAVDYEHNTESTNVTQVCWVYLAGAEITRQTGDMQYVRKFQDEIDGNSTFQSASVGRQPCIEAQFMLAEFAPTKNEYIPKARSSLAEFRAEFWDSEENNYLWGEGGTLPSVYQSHLIDTIVDLQIINSTDSAYFVYLLHLYETVS